MKQKSCFVLFLMLPFQLLLLAEDPSWQVNPFEISAEQMLRAVAALDVPENQKVDLLYSEHYYILNPDDTVVQRRRVIYRILNDSGLASWSETSSNWSPWYQNRPKFRVRILNPDGGEHWFDEGTLAESGGGVNGGMSQETRVVRGPIPSLTIGSLVVEEIKISEHQAFFQGGRVFTWTLQSGMPIRTSRLIIDGPKSPALNYRIRADWELEKYEEARGDGLRTVFVQHRVPALEVGEWGLPYDHPDRPYLVFSTTRSWQAIARGYAARIDRKLAEEDFAWMPEELVVAGNARATALRMLYWMNQKLRDTGMALGRGTIEPVSPSTCIKRGFGDCKDQAALLTGMLRKAGFQADVALLRASLYGDVDPDMPGLECFNRAVVVVYDEEILWLDPTYSYSREGILPPEDQHRWALIANPSTKALIKTPALPAEVDFLREERVYRLADKGPASVTVLFHSHGSFEREFRLVFDDVEVATSKERWQGFVEEVYGVAEIDDLHHSPAKDLNQPFTLKFELSKVDRAVTDQNEAEVAVVIWDLFRGLPETLTTQGKTRVEPYFFRKPFVHEIEYLVRPPEGFVPKDGPVGVERSVGTGKLSLQFENLENNAVKAHLKFHSGKRLLTAAEFNQYRAQVLEIKEHPAQIIYFEPAGKK